MFFFFRETNNVYYEEEHLELLVYLGGYSNEEEKLFRIVVRFCSDDTYRRLMAFMDTYKVSKKFKGLNQEGGFRKGFSFYF